MKSRWKKYAAFVGGAIVLLFIAVTAVVYAIYFGYYHINGSRAAKYPIHGVDVSHYQGEIDWNVLAAQNIQFAYIKATEGSSHVDEHFTKNYEEARQAGLRVGAYHFFSYDSSGITQAENFINTVENFDGMLPPVVDVEFYGNKEENPPAPEEVYPQLQAYLDAVEDAYGMRPMIYATNESWELYVQEQFDDYPLWIRDIWKKPKNTEDWTLWQYTNRGRLKGFSGEEPYVDLNVFVGTVEEWEQ
ncbi:MAG: glycoside hydrolase family 25 protein [Lachnospiraceae bacterium]|nr:glycoside hydrolase family 25 protein [Lachnospiraceae bacterium]